MGFDKGDEKGNLQYGAWMRGDPVKRLGVESGFSKKMEGERSINGMRIRLEEERNKLEKQREVVAREKQPIDAPFLEEGAMGQQEEKHVGGEMTTEKFHENGNVSKFGESTKETLAKLGKKKWEKEIVLNGQKEGMHKVTETRQCEIPTFDFKSAKQCSPCDGPTGLDLDFTEDGPVAMTYEEEVGWVADKLSPTNGHWKRRARANPGLENNKSLGPRKKKREGSSLEEIVQRSKESKRKKIEAQSKGVSGKELNKDGGVADATRQLRRAQ